MRFSVSSLRWSKLRRGLLTAALLTGLTAAAFYTLENFRGSRALDAAIDLANAERVPLNPHSVYAPAPPRERNLFHSPAFRNRMLWGPDDATDDHWGESGGLPQPIAWGDIHPSYTRSGKDRRLVRTDPRTGQSLDWAAVREAMKSLGWMLPETGSAANDVRTGLDRHQTELAEWSAELRKRPVWVPDPTTFSTIKALDALLFDTTRLLTLRAVAGAASGRPHSEILTDLESALLLAGHQWNADSMVNCAVWEVLRSRSLDDASLVALAEKLPDRPRTTILLARTWAESLAWIQDILSPLGNSGGEVAGDRYWKLYTLPELYPDELPILRGLKPAGWFRMEEAAMLQVMIENQRWLRQVDAAWGAVPPPEIHRNRMEPPTVAGDHVHYWNDLSYHLQSCGCPVSTITGRAVEARIAMIAIGLERYRLRHGQWPPDLMAASGLIPRSLRRNPMNGYAFGYQLLPDGGWKLTDGEAGGAVWLMPAAP